MRQVKPIARDKRIEEMRMKHLRQMRSNRRKYKATHKREEKQALKKEYAEMMEDLIEFDTYFVGTKYVLMNERDGHSSIFVNLSTGEGYYGIAAACNASGLSEDELEELIIAPSYVFDQMWRKVREV